MNLVNGSCHLFLFVFIAQDIFHTNDQGPIAPTKIHLLAVVKKRNAEHDMKPRILFLWMPLVSCTVGFAYDKR